MSASRPLAQLVLQRLCCDKTTEHGADEIIIYVVAACSDVSKSFVDRFPSSDHIDMNDGDQPHNNYEGDSHCIDDGYWGRNLFKSILEPEDSWEFVIIIREEDGGDTANAQRVLAAGLMEIGDPTALAAGALLEVVNRLGAKFVDSDDLIGKVGLTIRKDQGGPVRATGFAPIERATLHTEWPATHAEFRLNGDGSDYLAEFTLILS